MKYLDEYRNAAAVKKLTTLIHTNTTQPWSLMEICGGQTHAIMKFGIHKLIPSAIRLIHGPGCPVCVTPLELIDKAIDLASRPEVIFCSFGDMLRVPGSTHDLLAVKSLGGDVRIVYSPLDAVKIAQQHPQKEVVFFAVGFETTAPANAMAVVHAQKAHLKNFSLLVSHVLVPPAIEAILSSPRNQVQGFLAAGHVCTIMGTSEYEPLAKKYKTPMVVTGFEPVDILEGILMCVQQLEEGRYEVENQYARAVRAGGNQSAIDLIKKVFTIVPQKWRGLGEIPQSGLGLQDEFSLFDAEKKFDLSRIEAEESPDCISGEILTGLKKPPECAAFGTRCTPLRPLGAPMVSSEGACAAYYRYDYKKEVRV